MSVLDLSPKHVIFASDSTFAAKTILLMSPGRKGKSKTKTYGIEGHRFPFSHLSLHLPFTGQSCLTSLSKRFKSNRTCCTPWIFQGRTNDRAQSSNSHMSTGSMRWARWVGENRILCYQSSPSRFRHPKKSHVLLRSLSRCRWYLCEKETLLLQVLWHLG